MKKKYKVSYIQSSVCYVIVEAENEEEAKEIADEIDGFDFHEDPTSGDWEFMCVMEA